MAGRYRGRRRLRTARFMTTLGASLLAAALLCVALYLLLRPYFAWGDDGLEVSLPFWEGVLFSSQTPGGAEPDLIVIRVDDDMMIDNE